MAEKERNELLAKLLEKTAGMTADELEKLLVYTNAYADGKNAGLRKCAAEG